MTVRSFWPAQWDTAFLDGKLSPTTFRAEHCLSGWKLVWQRCGSTEVVKLIWLYSINDYLIFDQLNIAATAMFFADFLKRKPTNWMMLEISNHICWSLNSVVSKKQQAPSGCRRFFQDFGINRFEEEAFNKTN